MRWARSYTLRFLGFRRLCSGEVPSRAYSDCLCTISGAERDILGGRIEGEKHKKAIAEVRKTPATSGLAGRAPCRIENRQRLIRGRFQPGDQASPVTTTGSKG